MADNFTETSFIVYGTQEEVLALKAMLDEASEDEDICLSMSYHEYAEDVSAPPETRFAFGVYSDGCGFDDYYLTEVIQKWMRSINRTKPVSFSVSYTCSKPRVGEFGGESYVVTQDQVYCASSVFRDFLIANGVET